MVENNTNNLDTDPIKKPSSSSNDKNAVEQKETAESVSAKLQLSDAEETKKIFSEALEKDDMTKWNEHLVTLRGEGKVANLAGFTFDGSQSDSTYIESKVDLNGAFAPGIHLSNIKFKELNFDNAQFYSASLTEDGETQRWTSTFDQVGIQNGSGKNANFEGLKIDSGGLSLGGMRCNVDLEGANFQNIKGSGSIDITADTVNLKNIYIGDEVTARMYGSKSEITEMFTVKSPEAAVLLEASLRGNKVISESEFGGKSATDLSAKLNKYEKEELTINKDFLGDNQAFFSKIENKSPEFFAEYIKDNDFKNIDIVKSVKDMTAAEINDLVNIKPEDELGLLAKQAGLVLDGVGAKTDENLASANNSSHTSSKGLRAMQKRSEKAGHDTAGNCKEGTCGAYR
jgi:uncharacterized protein YjbI with pentapeptide repeats